MTKPRLSIARAQRKPAGPSLSLVKKALRLFRGRGVPKAVYRANAKKWLAANAMLGEHYLLKGQVLKGNILKGTAATWGVPGESAANQVHSPRRYSNGGK